MVEKKRVRREEGLSELCVPPVVLVKRPWHLGEAGWAGGHIPP